jgi:gas vesicle protein
MTKGKDFIKGAFLGALVGLGSGLLFAPKKGEETRGDIKKTYKEIKTDLAEKLSQMTEVTKSKYNQAVSSIVSGYEEAKKITPKQAREISNILEESFEKIAKAAKQ